MNNSIRVMIIAAAVSLALAGCTKKVKETPVTDSGPSDTTGATTGGVPDSTPVFANTILPITQRVV